jgi:hypothetical protein
MGSIRLSYVIWFRLLFFFTLTDSNTLESIQRNFDNLYHHHFYQSDISRNYDLALNCLNFRSLYFRRPLLDALFLINVLRAK